MACYYPIEGWRASQPNENGRYGLVFTKEGAQLDQPQTVACGRCIGCRLDKSREWALRCLHEADQHKENCFVTFTYSPENLPDWADLRKDHLTKFFKKLRKHLDYHHNGQKIRYFACGEYGDKSGRPHYHAIIFGYWPKDAEFFKKSGDHPLYRSDTLDKIWGLGYCNIGKVTFETAAYTARYTLKKRNGQEAEMHYTVVDEETGECYVRTPEYMVCSRRPGIGKKWFDKYGQDCLKGYLTNNGKKIPTPKYYERMMEMDDDYLLEIQQLKHLRSCRVDDLDMERKAPRLRVKEEVQNRKQRHYQRDIQNA